MKGSRACSPTCIYSEATEANYEVSSFCKFYLFWGLGEGEETWAFFLGGSTPSLPLPVWIVPNIFQILPSQADNTVVKQHSTSLRSLAGWETALEEVGICIVEWRWLFVSSSLFTSSLLFLYFFLSLLLCCDSMFVLFPFNCFSLRAILLSVLHLTYPLGWPGSTCTYKEGPRSSRLYKWSLFI